MTPSKNSETKNKIVPFKKKKEKKMNYIDLAKKYLKRDKPDKINCRVAYQNKSNLAQLKN